MKVANIKTNNSSANSYNPNLLSSVPPNSQVEEQQSITICNHKIPPVDPENRSKFTQRKRKLQNRKKNKKEKRVAWLDKLSQHEKLLTILDSHSAQRDGIFSAKTRVITESERQQIGKELASEVAEKEDEIDNLLSTRRSPNSMQRPKKREYKKE